MLNVGRPTLSLILTLSVSVFVVFAKNYYGGPQSSEDILNEKFSEILEIYVKLEPGWIKLWILLNL